MCSRSKTGTLQKAPLGGESVNTAVIIQTQHVHVSERGCRSKCAAMLGAGAASASKLQRDWRASSCHAGTTLEVAAGRCSRRSRYISEAVRGGLAGPPHGFTMCQASAAGTRGCRARPRAALGKGPMPQLAWCAPGGAALLPSAVPAASSSFSHAAQGPHSQQAQSSISPDGVLAALPAPAAPTAAASLGGAALDISRCTPA